MKFYFTYTKSINDNDQDGTCYIIFILSPRFLLGFIQSTKYDEYS